jgi:hypothetical protein
VCIRGTGSQKSELHLKEKTMYIGVGTVVVILLIVIIFLLLRGRSI